MTPVHIEGDSAWNPTESTNLVFSDDFVEMERRKRSVQGPNSMAHADEDLFDPFTEPSRGNETFANAWERPTNSNQILVRVHVCRLITL